MFEPPHLQLNARFGRRSEPERASARAKAWALGRQVAPGKTHLAPPERANLADWRDRNVGWGLVVAKAAVGKLPPAARRLLALRAGAPVFAYVPNRQHSFTLLEHVPTGAELDVNGSPLGVGAAGIPYYLLILGSPRDVPWRLQYVLNTNRCVGRLDLDERGLERYVGAVADDFGPEPASPYSTLSWAVHHGADDITGLMHDQIAAAVHTSLLEDAEMRSGARFIGRGTASCATLLGALADGKPGLVITTSHGQVDTAAPPKAARKTLGLPVDQDGEVLEIDRVLERWQPRGAIWYSHACCSAGSDDLSIYGELFEDGSPNGATLRRVTTLGAAVAPFPTRLLGAEQPLRAFIGHVEPTFDWTLRHPGTGQPLSHATVDALYGNLYRGDPIGLAFRHLYAKIGGFYAGHVAERDAYNNGAENLEALLYLQLAARDIQSTVILGDPAVALPLRARA